MKEAADNRIKVSQPRVFTARDAGGGGDRMTSVINLN